MKPIPKRAIDLGRELVHDMKGNVRHYVHSIAVPRDWRRMNPEWSFRYGYRDPETRALWNVYTRREPAE